MSTGEYQHTQFRGMSGTSCQPQTFKTEHKAAIKFAFKGAAVHSPHRGLSKALEGDFFSGSSGQRDRGRAQNRSFEGKGAGLAAACYFPACFASQQRRYIFGFVAERNKFETGFDAKREKFDSGRAGACQTSGWIFRNSLDSGSPQEHPSVRVLL